MSRGRLSKSQEQLARRAGRMIAEEQMDGDQVLRIISTYRVDEGLGVGIRFNDGRTLPLSVAVLDMIEKHIGAARGSAA